MDNNNQNRNNGKKPNSQNIGVMVLILMITLGVVSMMNSALKQNQTQELGYEEFVQMVEDGEVDTIRFSGNRILITPKTSSTKYSRLIQYYTVRVQDAKVTDRLLEKDVHILGEDTNAGASILSFIMGWVLPSVLMIGLLYFMFSRMGGGAASWGLGRAMPRFMSRRKQA